MINVIPANWPAAKNVIAFTTTRHSGVSLTPYEHLNLAEHVGDNPDHVRINRQQLITELHLPNQPAWLQQTHSNRVVTLSDNYQLSKADAAYTHQPRKICIVLTADCLPILLCNQQGTEVAAIHCGWRGMVKNIIENTVATLSSQPQNLLAWLGPAIGPRAFEVGEDVKQQFTRINPESTLAFLPSLRKAYYFSNLYLLAQQRLQTCGIKQIYGGDFCTYRDAEDFFSYRRDGQTGRMASLIYLV